MVALLYKMLRVAQLPTLLLFVFSDMPGPCNGLLGLQCQSALAEPLALGEYTNLNHTSRLTGYYCD